MVGVLCEECWLLILLISHPFSEFLLLFTLFSDLAMVSRFLSALYVYISSFGSSVKWRAAPKVVTRKVEVSASSTQLGMAASLVNALAQMQQLQAASPYPGVVISVHLWQQHAERIAHVTMPHGFNVIPPEDPYMLKPLGSSSQIQHVFSLIEDPGLVLVYRQFCVEEDNVVDPAIRDFWFLRYIEPLEVAPKVYLVSEVLYSRLLVEHWAAANTPARQVPGKIKLYSCGNHRRNFSRIRYVLMDMVEGSSIDALMLHDVGCKVRVGAAARWGVLLVGLLQKLHERNVIHGDIHWGNVVVSTDNTLMKLIDFRRAIIYDKTEAEARFSSCRKRRLAIHRCSSGSFRDDLWRALVVVASGMHGGRYGIHFRSLFEGGSSGRRLGWNEAHVFNVPGTDWKVKSLRHNFEKLNEKLNRITSLVTRLGIHDRPNYGTLIALFQDVVDLAEHTTN